MPAEVMYLPPPDSVKMAGLGMRPQLIMGPVDHQPVSKRDLSTILPLTSPTLSIWSLELAGLGQAGS